MRACIFSLLLLAGCSTGTECHREMAEVWVGLDYNHTYHDGRYSYLWRKGATCARVPAADTGGMELHRCTWCAR